MLIDIFRDNAEQKLLSRLEQGIEHKSGRGALYFPRHSLKSKPREEDLAWTVKDELVGRKPAIYLFRDGDIIITWNGVQTSLMESVCASVYRRFGQMPKQTHYYYDALAQAEELRLLCRRKIERMNGATNPKPAFRLSPQQAKYFRIARASRRNRPHLELLVVEDMQFSAMLLNGLLRKDYRTHTAYNAEEGLKMYFVHAPDIVLLDIELPGMDGHAFTETILSLDPDAYIVMVSANNYVDDVLRAKENGIKAFVVKPYSKKKIMEVIDGHLAYRQQKK